MKPTKKLPLFSITGASCAGKTTVCNELFKKETDYITQLGVKEYPVIVWITEKDEYEEFIEKYGKYLNK